MKFIKKFLAFITSFILIFSVGTTSALADNGSGALSFFTGSDVPQTAQTGDLNSDDANSDDDQTPAETDENDQDEPDISADGTDETSEAETGGTGEESDPDETLSDETGDAEEVGDTEEDGEDSEETDAGEEETDEADIALLSAQTVDEYLAGYINDPTELESISLRYDDRYDLSDLSGISGDVDYTILMSDTDRENITSNKVVNGEVSEDKDDMLITQINEGCTKVAATGVGSGDVYIIATSDLDYLENLAEEFEPEEDATDPDDESNDDDDTDKVDVYKLKVTVTAAPLTLMFLAGQSNMEGQCSDSTGYHTEESVACTDGTVYSTYMPSTDTRAHNITGITSLTASNASVAGSLQGASTTSKMSEYTIGGTLEDPKDMSGDALIYPLDSLTESGNGKTGPDSGLAYEWNKETRDKVWVINTAYGSSDISSWIPGKDNNNYSRSVEVWEEVLKTYKAEISAKHYTNGNVSGNKMVFWLQGETGDAYNTPADAYESSFKDMYKWMCDELGSNVPFGIIMVRAGNEAKSPTTEKDLTMTGPRIAQYFLGSSNSSYGNVFVVSNANEQWVSNSGVTSYFKSAYSGGSFNYPMQNASKSLPTAVNEVHGDIHYSQVAHNENGITAAYGMMVALGIKSDSTSPKVTWKDEDGSAITSLTLDYASDYTTVVPVVDPVYKAKSVGYDISGTSISYDYSTGIVTAASYTSTGTSKITPSGASGTLSVTVSNPVIETDIVKIDGVWTYTVNGSPDYTYTGMAQNSNGWYYITKGVLDRTYTGFAKNENGSWYITEGKLTRKDNSVIKDENGALGSTSEWYYVLGSKVQSDFTGLADYQNDSGWWYITKGKVDRSVTTVAKNKNGWYYVKNGKVDKSYTGFAKNSNGSWYVVSGKVTKKVNGVYKDANGSIGAKNNWYYVVGNKVQSDFTGLANYKNDSGWWYITKGKVDRSVNTVAKNKNGWYYVVNGKVQKSFTGLANYKNDSGWWYIKNGAVDRTFTGIASNKNGQYYLKNGKVQRITGSVKVNGKTYKLKEGKVV